MNYTDIKEQRNALADLMQQQSGVLKALAMTTRVDLIHKLRERLLADNFKVLVIGEFKTGKSTFINALLREKVLPTYAIPCTAIINEVKWGQERKALLHFEAPENGSAAPPKEVPVEELEDYVVIKDYIHKEEEIRENPYEKVELFYPLGLCRNGVEIIDSPGLNEGKVREKITIDYLGAVDAVLFMLSAITPGVSNSEELSLDHIRSAGHEDIFFIYNRINQINPDEQELVKQHCVRRIEALTKRTDVRIFFINALGALKGYLDTDPALVEESEVPQLEVALEKFLAEERGRMKIGRPAHELKESIKEARRTIPERKAMLEEPLNTLEKRYETAKERLRQLELQRQQTFDHVKEIRKLINRAVATEARSFYVNLAESVQDWVQNYTVQKPIKSEDLQTTETENLAAERVSDEVAQYIADRIESETIEWQEAELQPLVTENVEELSSYLDVRMGEFLRQLDHIRAELSSGTAPSSLSDHADEEVTEPLNRVLAAIGGDVIDATGRPSIGGVFGYQGKDRSLIKALAAAAAGLLALAATRSPAAATFLGSGVARVIGEIFDKSQANEVNTKIKNGVGQEYAKWLREHAKAESKKVADAVGKQFGELENALSQAMDVHFNSIHEQVKSILAEKKKGQAEADRLAKELTAIRE